MKNKGCLCECITDCRVLLCHCWQWVLDSLFCLIVASTFSHLTLLLTSEEMGLSWAPDVFLRRRGQGACPATTARKVWRQQEHLVLLTSSILRLHGAEAALTPAPGPLSWEVGLSPCPSVPPSIQCEVVRALTEIGGRGKNVSLDGHFPKSW